LATPYLDGTYSEVYPDISQDDEAGLRKLFIPFSFPGGIPSHASPECPGSIHEGGEPGYSPAIRWIGRRRRGEDGSGGHRMALGRRAEELPTHSSTSGATLKPELAELAPKGERRMGANAHANGGILLRELRMPDFRDYAVEVPSASATRMC
jgi:phosphoketolase